MQTRTPLEHQHSTGYTDVLLTAHDNHMLHVDDSMAFGMPTADVTQAFSSIEMLGRMEASRGRDIS